MNGFRCGIFFLATFLLLFLYSTHANIAEENVNGLPQPLNRIQNIHYGNIARNPMYVSYSKTLRLNPKKNIYLYQNSSVDEFTTTMDFVFDGLKIPKKSTVLAQRPYARCRYEKVVAIHWKKISGWYAVQGLIMPDGKLCYLTAINSPQIKKGKRYRNLLVEPEPKLLDSYCDATPKAATPKAIGDKSKNVNQGNDKNVVSKKR
jgi:hypothetical protein